MDTTLTNSPDILTADETGLAVTFPLGEWFWITFANSEGEITKEGWYEVRDIGNRSLVLTDKDGNTLTLKVIGQGE